MIRIARKEHICSGCGDPIAVGESYAESTTSIYRGRKISVRVRLHLECDAFPSLEEIKKAYLANGLEPL